MQLISSLRKKHLQNNNIQKYKIGYPIVRALNYSIFAPLLLD